MFELRSHTIKEHVDGGHHLEQPLLDDPHLVLPRDPSMTEKEMERVGWDSWWVDLTSVRDASQPTSSGRTRLLQRAHALCGELLRQEQRREK